MAKGKVYLLGWEYVKQNKIIDDTCFSLCKKIIPAVINMDGKEWFVCRTDGCPIIDEQTAEPIAEYRGDMVYIRKMKEPEGNIKWEEVGNGEG